MKFDINARKCCCVIREVPEEYSALFEMEFLYNDDDDKSI